MVVTSCRGTSRLAVLRRAPPCSAVLRRAAACSTSSAAGACAPHSVGAPLEVGGAPCARASGALPVATVPSSVPRRPEERSGPAGSLSPPRNRRPARGPPAGRGISRRTRRTHPSWLPWDPTWLSPVSAHSAPLGGLQRVQQPTARRSRSLADG